MVQNEDLFYELMAKSQEQAFGGNIKGAIKTLQKTLALYQIKIPEQKDHSILGIHAYYEELHEAVGRLFEWLDDEDVRSWTSEQWKT